eukprot:4472591-Amphidinium_carterae.1
MPRRRSSPSLKDELNARCTSCGTGSRESLSFEGAGMVVKRTKRVVNGGKAKDIFKWPRKDHFLHIDCRKKNRAGCPMAGSGET